MKNNLIKTSAAIPSLRVADVDYNTDQIIDIIKKHGKGVIVFPELCITGYTCADLFGSELLLSKAEDALFRIADETADCKGLTAVVSLPVRYENSFSDRSFESWIIKRRARIALILVVKCTA